MCYVKTKLFIDDERFPITDDWAIARSSDEAILYIMVFGIPNEIAFDHDLGGDDTSRIFINKLSNYMLDTGAKFPKGFIYNIHSQNPIGVNWIKSTMDKLIEHIGYSY